MNDLKLFLEKAKKSQEDNSIEVYLPSIKKNVRVRAINGTEHSTILKLSTQDLFLPFAFNAWLNKNYRSFILGDESPAWSHWDKLSVYYGVRQATKGNFVEDEADTEKPAFPTIIAAEQFQLPEFKENHSIEIDEFIFDIGWPTEEMDAFFHNTLSASTKKLNLLSKSDELIKADIIQLIGPDIFVLTYPYYIQKVGIGDVSMKITPDNYKSVFGGIPASTLLKVQNYIDENFAKVTKKLTSFGDGVIVDCNANQLR